MSKKLPGRPDLYVSDYGSLDNMLGNRTDGRLFYKVLLIRREIAKKGNVR